MLRHHRLLERYLVDRLGLSLDEVHAEAELLEHALSEELEARIDEELGYPTHDPHGDPIPDRALRLVHPDDRTLLGARVGRARRRSRAFRTAIPRSCATWASSASLPGSTLELVAYAPFGGPVTVRTERWRARDLARPRRAHRRGLGRQVDGLVGARAAREARLQDGAVRDDERQQADRQCRNWPDHSVRIGRRAAGRHPCIEE